MLFKGLRVSTTWGLHADAGTHNFFKTLLRHKVSFAQDSGVIYLSDAPQRTSLIVPMVGGQAFEKLDLDPSI